MSAEARRFGAALAEASGLEIEFHDEGLTSWEAEEAVKASGARLSAARKRGDVDRGAACGLLRSWLQERDSAPPPPSEA